MNIEKNTLVDETHPLFPSGEWEGFYTYAFGPEARKHKMSLEINFKNNLISGSGADDVGTFNWKGNYDTDVLKCTMHKHYASHSVLYEGSADENGIWGTWSIQNLDKGGFHIWPKPSAVKEFETEKESAPEKIQIKIVVIKKV